MRTLYFTVLISLSILLLGGCGTKRQNFEPKDISYSIHYDGSLPSELVDVTRSGATLKNGQIITKDGLQNVKLPAGYVFLNDDNGRYLATSKCGELIVVDKNSKIIYKRKFDNSIASAVLKGSKIALVLSSNAIVLLDMKTDKIELNLQQDDVYALDSRIAAPYFLDSLIIYPTLDGRLLIVDSKSKKVIRNIVISDEKFFGNVIYLGVLGNRLVAATNKRVVSISPKTMSTLDENVKDVIVLKGRIFVFTNDGTVILANEDLKVLKRKKFTFAIFSGVIYGKYIYMIERGGYLIATDIDLISANVYKIPDEISTYLYFTKDEFYYKDKYFRLSHKR
ncbi:MAG: hypothetical protein R3331_07625 [Sulfurospirillaceae bacterium]|nr:hypothetical protein [Sulfurospirillaceae bacterium]